MTRPERFEMWVSRHGRFALQGATRDWPTILAALNTPAIARRKHVRVRAFYDRTLRRRVVQVLVGAGFGVRN